MQNSTVAKLYARRHSKSLQHRCTTLLLSRIHLHGLPACILIVVDFRWFGGCADTANLHLSGHRKNGCLCILSLWLPSAGLAAVPTQQIIAGPWQYSTLESNCWCLLPLASLRMLWWHSTGALRRASRHRLARCVATLSALTLFLLGLIL